MYYTVIKHSSHLRTLEKYCYISLVVSNACRVLSQCNTRLRLLYLLNNCKVLTSAHPLFNNLIDDKRPSRKSLDSLSSLYDLSVFQLNSLDEDIDPDRNFHSNKILSKYYSPHSFAQFIESKQLQSKISFLHTNIRSLKKNLEEFQHHVLRTFAPKNFPRTDFFLKL